MNSDNIGFLGKMTIVIILIGLGIRLQLAPLMTYPFDIEHWAVILQNIDSGNGLYNLSGYFYTPAWGYLLGFENFVLDSLGGLSEYGKRFTDLIPIETLNFRFHIATLTTPTFNLVMKIPLIIVDFLVGYFIWDFVLEKTNDTRKATLAFALWFLSPITIYMSGSQAMFDCISALFTLLSLLLLRRSYYLFSGIVFTGQVLVKFFPLALFPIFLLYMLKNESNRKRRYQNLSMWLAGQIQLFILLYIPAILNGTFVDSLSFIINRATESIWWQTLYTTANGILAIVIVLYVTLKMYREKTNESLDDKLIAYSAIVLQAAVIVSSGPQYCIVFLPLLAYFAVTADNKFYSRLMIVMGISAAICAFLNNSLSVFLSIAEFNNWGDPVAILNAMTQIDSSLWFSVTAAVVGNILYLSILFSIIFLFDENFKVFKNTPVEDYLNRIKNAIGGI